MRDKTVKTVSNIHSDTLSLANSVISSHLSQFYKHIISIFYRCRVGICFIQG